jgi:glutamine---fructose-6-phosphate transaminase (isomerizing)
MPMETDMCGIYGYVGEPTDLGTSVLQALKTLEYRGYDSWGVGIAVNNHIEIEKEIGKIGRDDVSFPRSDLGFGHTRWATHGGVTEANAHPHLDCTGKLAVIHNGIIENFRTLRAELVESGHVFRSETDSEVMAHLLEHELAITGGNFVKAFRQAFSKLEGLNAIIAMDSRTRELVAAKTVSPLVVGTGLGRTLIASDAVALRGQVTQVL